MRHNIFSFLILLVALVPAPLVANGFIVDDARAKIWHQGPSFGALTNPNSRLDRQYKATCRRQIKFQPIATLYHGSAVHALAFSPDSRYLATGSNDAQIRLWHSKDGTSVGDALSGHPKWISALHFAPQGEMLYSTDWSGNLFAWDIQRGQILSRITPHASKIYALTLTTDGTLLASSGADKAIRLWHNETSTRVNPKATATAVYRALTFDHSGHYIFAGNDAGMLEKWQVSTNQLINQAQLNAHRPGRILALERHPNGNFIASVHDTNQILIWDTATLQIVAQQSFGDQPPLLDIAFTPDGKWLAASGKSTNVYLWSLGDRRIPLLTVPLSAHQDWIYKISFSANGHYFATASRDHSARVWRVLCTRAQRG